MAFFISIQGSPFYWRPLIPCLFLTLFVSISVLILVQKIGFLDALLVAFIPIGTVIFGAVCILMAGALFLLIALIFNFVESKLFKKRGGGGPEQSSLHEDPVEKKTSKIFVALRKITMTKPMDHLEIGDLRKLEISREMDTSDVVI